MPLPYLIVLYLPADNSSGDSDFSERRGSIVEFRWARRDTCTGQFFCTQLKGNVCGNYGLSLLYGQDYCFENRSLPVDLSQSKQELDVSLWSVDADIEPIQAVCYLWCTKDGSLPGSSQDEYIKADPTVADLNGASEGLGRYETSWTDGVTHPLSPFSLFHLSHNFTGDAKCREEGDLCDVSARFVWYGRLPCQVNVRCQFDDTLAGQECATGIITHASFIFLLVRILASLCTILEEII